MGNNTCLKTPRYNIDWYICRTTPCGCDRDGVRRNRDFKLRREEVTPETVRISRGSYTENLCTFTSNLRLGRMSTTTLTRQGYDLWWGIVLFSGLHFVCRCSCHDTWIVMTVTMRIEETMFPSWYLESNRLKEANCMTFVGSSGRPFANESSTTKRAFASETFERGMRIMVDPVIASKNEYCIRRYQGNWFRWPVVVGLAMQMAERVKRSKINHQNVIFRSWWIQDTPAHPRMKARRRSPTEVVELLQQLPSEVNSTTIYTCSVRLKYIWISATRATNSSWLTFYEIYSHFQVIRHWFIMAQICRVDLRYSFPRE